MRRYPGNFTDSELLTLPRNLRTSPDGLDSQLAYVTQPEIDMIVKANPHGSMQGKPNRGPEGVPSLDGDYGTFAPSRPTRPSGGSSGGGGSWGGEREDRGGGESQQDIINRNNKNRIDKIKENQRKEEIAAAGRQWDPRADDWKKDYSHSTRDVRSSPNDRLAFTERIAEGGGKTEVYTLAEQLARKAYALTNDPKYLNMPIFVPKGMTDEQYKALLAKGDEALKTGDNEIFFEAMEGLQDITAGNPNLDFQQGFGTGYDDWYKPQPLQGGGGGGYGGWGGYGGYGGGGGGGGYGYAEEDFMPQGNPNEAWGAQNPLQQAMISLHGGQGFQQGFRRGGIVGLVT
jgi:hypothetical protein